MKITEKAAEIAIRLANDNRYGYSNDWPNNRFGVDDTPYDGDCGAFCSYVYQLVGIIPEGQYYEPTGNKIPYNDEMLRKYFDRYDYSTERNKVGDIITSNGHTVMIVGVDPDTIAHASDDYDGASGDSSGNEVRVQALYNNAWNWIYRLKDELNTEWQEEPAEEECEVILWEVKNGSEGGHVKTLQSVLNTKNSAGLLVDGQCGALTEQAIRDWQTKYGLYVDGVCGELTWNDLLTRNC